MEKFRASFLAFGHRMPRKKQLRTRTGGEVSPAVVRFYTLMLTHVELTQRRS